MKKALYVVAIATVVTLFVNQLVSMEVNPGRRQAKFIVVRDNRQSSCPEPRVAVLIYSYDPASKLVEARGIKVDPRKGETNLRVMDFFKGPLVDNQVQSSSNSKIKRLWKKSRRSAEPQAPVKEGYIQSIEVEDDLGVNHIIDSDTVEFINKVLDENPHKIITFQIIRNEDPFNHKAYYVINLIDVQPEGGM